MKSIIYPKAGKIILVKYTSQGLSYVPDNMIKGNGTVNSIQSSVTINTSQLPDGNSDWPMGVYDVGQDGSIAVNMSSFRPELYAALIGAAVSELSNSDMWACEEEKTIPSTSPFTASLSHVVKSGGTIVIVDADASPMVSVATGPSQGQYSISQSVATFNSADAGKEIFATFEWVATTSLKMGLPEAASRPVMQAIISTEATDEDGVEIYDTNIIVDKCKSTGDVNPPQQQREPQGWNFTLKVLKPRPGNNPVYYKYAKRA